MTRKLIIFFLLCLTSNSIYTMDKALCLIPNALELLQCFDRTIPEVCTFTHTGINVYHGLPLLAVAGCAGILYEIYNIIQHPTQELQRYSRRSDRLTLVPFLLRKGGNPFRCIDIEYDPLVHDSTERNPENNNDHNQQLPITRCAAIHRAAHSAHLTLLKIYLTHKNQDDDIDIQNNFGETPLILASCSSSEDTAACIRLLIQHGACLQSTTVRGLSSLHFAAYNRSEDALRELLRLGADVHATDFKGNTPLHYAARASFSKGIGLLLQYGAAPDARNHQQQTPLESTLLMAAPAVLRSTESQRQVILFEDNPCLNRLLPSGANMVYKLLFKELGLK